MSRCPSCLSEVNNDCNLCPSCGAEIQPPAVQPTATSPRKDQNAESYKATAPSDSIDHARFTPGTMLADRYRIVGLLGEGGMGEVYRAEDLKLRQTVALKFLPKSLMHDANRLERFHQEVRVARQVSHPNVCRVYDILEASGQHFISMEYIDGEDLASVLRRMGRPSTEKAVQIARQLCAGLAAAHNMDVLHRDLKPHNVMIDGQGAVRVTDFGLAAFAGEVDDGDEGAGTPAYMAPEQLAGREVSLKSDLYSLGLVLYELFSGKRLFAGVTREQVERHRKKNEPSTDVSLAEDLDPAIERVIQRCLETEPAARPPSALAVAAALPGGDPLAAALAEGDTPSPRLVADAFLPDACKPGYVLACIALSVIGVVAYGITANHTQITNRVPLPASPDVLKKTARDLLTEIGYGDPPGDHTWGFQFHHQNIRRLHDEYDSSANEQLLADGWPAIHFWYRESPLKIVPYDRSRIKPSPYDPPRVQQGMVRIWMSAQGTLVALGVVPPYYAPYTSSAQEPDWTPLFQAARVDVNTLMEIEPTWTPNVNTDMRRAWKAETVPPLVVELQVEAAAFQGRPVYFSAGWPRNAPPSDSAETQPGTLVTLKKFVDILWFPICIVGALLLARRNLQIGRADRRTAVRLGFVVFASRFVCWLFSAHHVGSNAQVTLILANVADGLLNGAIVCVTYLAIEPFFRRVWPHWLVSWVRLFDGRLRDPLVGRDVLVGLIAGILFAILEDLYYLVPNWLGMESPVYGTIYGPMEVESLGNLRHSLGVIASVPDQSIQFVLIGVMMLLLLRLVLKRNLLAYVGWVILSALLFNPGQDSLLFDLAFTVVLVLFAFSVLLRFGLLALVVCNAVSVMIESVTFTPELSSWYASGTLMALSVLAVIGAYAVKTSLGGQPLIRPSVLDS